MPKHRPQPMSRSFGSTPEGYTHASIVVDIKPPHAAHVEVGGSHQRLDAKIVSLFHSLLHFDPSILQPRVAEFSSSQSHQQPLHYATSSSFRSPRGAGFDRRSSTSTHPQNPNDDPRRLMYGRLSRH